MLRSFLPALFVRTMHLWFLPCPSVRWLPLPSDSSCFRHLIVVCSSYFKTLALYITIYVYMIILNSLLVRQRRSKFLPCCCWDDNLYQLLRKEYFLSSYCYLVFMFIFYHNAIQNHTLFLWYIFTEKKSTVVKRIHAVLNP